MRAASLHQRSDLRFCVPKDQRFQPRFRCLLQLGQPAVVADSADSPDGDFEGNLLPRCGFIVYSSFDLHRPAVREDRGDPSRPDVLQGDGRSAAEDAHALLAGLLCALHFLWLSDFARSHRRKLENRLRVGEENGTAPTVCCSFPVDQGCC